MLPDNTSLTTTSGRPTWSRYVLLGRGGSHPGVTALDPTTGTTSEAIMLSAGDSVYALDTSPDGSSLVVGTKSGIVRQFRSPQGATDGEIGSEVQQTFDLPRAPILDATFFGADRIVVANQLGGCWMCPIHRDLGTPYPIATAGRTVCALVAISDRILAGLSTGGDLLIWDLADPRSPRVAGIGPMPPNYSGLVTLRLWEARNALVYPGDGGQLAVFGIQDERIEIINAHNGPAYAFCFDREIVMTIGKEDGLARTWARDLSPAGPPLTCPSGIISIGALSGETDTFLLVGKDGAAGTYSRTADCLQRAAHLTGSAFRAVREAGERDVAAVRSDRIELRAREIAHRLCSSATTANNDDTAPLHDELCDLGFPHVSLAIKIDVAQRRGTRCEAVEHAPKLISLLPDAETTKTRRSLLRCADLFEKVWMLHCSLAVRRRASGCGDTDAYDPAMLSLQDRAEAMAGDKWIAFPDMPITDIAACATALKETFQGRWLFREQSPLVCRGVSVSPSAFVRRHNAAYSGPKNAIIPAPHAARMQIIKSNAVTEEQVIVFGSLHPKQTGAMVYCLRLDSDAQQTVAIPSLVYAVPASPGGVSATEHNARVVAHLTDASASKTVGTHLATVHERVVAVLKRMASTPQRRARSIS